ncbi:hypothetical protein Aduo_003585 [Ancylostoma duodenale]
MCILIEVSTVTSLSFSKLRNLTGTCRGHRLRIIQNNLLRTIEFDPYFMRHASASSVLVRGNRNLYASEITKLKRGFGWYAIDLQEHGECGVPHPFKSFQDLQGCTNAYGLLAVRGSKNVRRSPSVKISLTGCLLIENTGLSNVDFLDDITNFTLVEDMCSHNIYNNKNLCIVNPQKLKIKFKGLYIDQSTTPNCETICSGGVVDEEYLATVEGCQVIDGDLNIDGWEKPPSHLDNLQTVTRINGSLHIRNTTGLGVFDYFGALKEVTVPKGKNATAIEIVNNRGLTEIQIPYLERISSENSMRIVITDNPALGMKESMAQKLYDLADGKRHTRIHYKDKTTFWDDLMDNKLYLVIFIMLCLIMIMILLISTLLIMRTVKRRQVETKEGFPKPPWKLQKQSKEILVGWVKNILLKNPLIWRCSDREVIWPYQERDATREFTLRGHLYNDINVLVTNNEIFLKEHMLPTAANGRIPSNDNFLLFERVKSVMNNDVVIMIGNEKYPSCVLPNIPYELKNQHAYKYKGTTHTFKLIKIKQMAPCTHEFSYLVTTVAKGGKKGSKKQEKRIKEIVYYRWDNRIMPLEYDEILQLAMMYKPERTICISNRRKEVFSLIHMFHTYCCILKEEITVSDVLQLHTEKCNGSILDRNELVFVMAVIMEWAYQSRSLPDDLKKKHMDWCHSYAIMAKFMRNNPNIKYIHPDYLTKLDAKTRQSVYNEGFTSSPRFSTRESGAVTDPFHRKDVKQHTMYLKLAKPAKTQDEEEQEEQKFWLGDGDEKVKAPLLENRQPAVVAV